MAKEAGQYGHNENGDARSIDQQRLKQGTS